VFPRLQKSNIVNALIIVFLFCDEPADGERVGHGRQPSYGGKTGATCKQKIASSFVDTFRQSALSFPPWTCEGGMDGR
jgi:hypothetical protein